MRGQEVETNVSVWAPALPTAFENARDATIFTRLETNHPSCQLASVADASAEVQQTFCLCINNVFLVFSASPDDHAQHIKKVLRMMQANSMTICLPMCVFNVPSCFDAGIQLDRVGTHKTFMVINAGSPKLVSSLKP